MNIQTELYDGPSLWVIISEDKNNPEMGEEVFLTKEHLLPLPNNRYKIFGLMGNFYHTNGHIVEIIGNSTNTIWLPMPAKPYYK